jgi:hypothetical protein
MTFPNLSRRRRFAALFPLYDAADSESQQEFSFPEINMHKDQISRGGPGVLPEHGRQSQVRPHTEMQSLLAHRAAYYNEDNSDNRPLQLSTTSIEQLSQSDYLETAGAGFIFKNKN